MQEEQYTFGPKLISPYIYITPKLSEYGCITNIIFGKIKFEKHANI